MTKLRIRSPFRCFTAATALIGALALCGCPGLTATRHLKLGHSLDTTHPVHLAMAFMATRLVSLSGGRLGLDIYPSEQLGNERDSIELLQVGSLTMTKTSTSVLEGFIPEMKLFSLPYLFRDDAHRWAVLNGSVGRQLLEAGEKVHLKGLAYYDAGSRSFYTRSKPIRTPADLKGMKIRVQKAYTSMRMVQAMGGAPTPIAWGELYTALQQGVVDGAENNPPSLYLSRQYETCKYYSLDEHTAVPDILLISLDQWNRLTEEERVWLQQAVDESVVLQRKLWADKTAEALNKMQADAGTEILHPAKAPFQQAVQPLVDEYMQDPAMADLIRQIQTTPSGEAAS